MRSTANLSASEWSLKLNLFDQLSRRLDEAILLAYQLRTEATTDLYLAFRAASISHRESLVLGQALGRNLSFTHEHDLKIKRLDHMIAAWSMRT